MKLLTLSSSTLAICFVPFKFPLSSLTSPLVCHQSCLPKPLCSTATVSQSMTLGQGTEMWPISTLKETISSIVCMYMYMYSYVVQCYSIFSCSTLFFLTIFRPLLCLAGFGNLRGNMVSNYMFEANDQIKCVHVQIVILKQNNTLCI